MSKEVTIPVLVNDAGIIKRISEVRFRKDGSLYIYFPNKHGYQVARHAKNIKLRPGATDIDLSDNSKPIGTPYISYHPGKGSIHSNLQPSKDIYIRDSPVVQIQNEENLPCFSLCQIILSRSDFLEEYNKAQNPEELVINAPAGITKALQIELYIHPKDRHIAFEDLPLIEEKQNLQEIIQFACYQNTNLPLISISALVTAIPLASKLEGVPYLNIIIWKKGGPTIFELQPK